MSDDTIEAGNASQGKQNIEDSPKTIKILFILVIHSFSLYLCFDICEWHSSCARIEAKLEPGSQLKAQVRASYQCSVDSDGVVRGLNVKGFGESSEWANHTSA